MSLIGFVLLIARHRLWPDRQPEPDAWRRCSPSRARQLALMLIGYGFVASVLPVWLLLAPRDYLSTFLKIGTILALAVGIVIVHAGAADAGADPIHRRHRPGVQRAPCSRSCSSPSPAARSRASMR